MYCGQKCLRLELGSSARHHCMTCTQLSNHAFYSHRASGNRDEKEHHRGRRMVVVSVCTGTGECGSGHHSSST